MFAVIIVLASLVAFFVFVIYAVILFTIYNWRRP
jgi:hypothetical protein